MPWISGLISGLGSLFGSALGFGSQQMTNAQSMELAEYQHQKNLEMWHRQNAYNAPTAQMQRLREAGLNPNLVYGNGAVGNASSEPPKYQAPTLGAYTNFGDLGVGSGMDAYLRSQYQQEEILNKRADTEGKKLNNNRTEFEIAMQGIEEASRLYDLALKIGNVDLQDLAKQKEEASIDLIRTNIVDIESQIDYRDFVQTPNTKSATEKNNAETRYINGPKTANAFASTRKLNADAAGVEFANTLNNEARAELLNELKNRSHISDAAARRLFNDANVKAQEYNNLVKQGKILDLTASEKYWDVVIKEFHYKYGIPLQMCADLVSNLIRIRR